MIRTATDKHPGSINANTVHAVDGKLGTITDLLFDDLHWTVRYLVVHVAAGLASHDTLISPVYVSGANRQSRTLHIDIGKQRAQQAPFVEANLPVASQQEVAYYDYLGVSPYWDPMAPGSPATEGSYLAYTSRIESVEEEGERASADPHLRSAREVVDYRINTADDSVGHIEDLLINDESWRLCYVAVDTRNWLPAKKVLVPPEFITGIDWALQSISVDLGSQKLSDAPGWDPNAPIDQDYETRLREYYHRSSHRMEEQ